MTTRKFTTDFEDILTANRNGEVKNLLITDNNTEFLDDALYALHSWVIKNDFNIVELDERDPSWLSEIQSFELFDKLNKTNTVLLIRNYATVDFHKVDKNTPRRFLRTIVTNRHYSCGNDFDPSYDLPNLLFVVAINDLSEMKWRSNEYMMFSIIHQDNSKRVWTNTKFTLLSSKMHPVMTGVNKVIFLVSDDETTLCVDAGEAFRKFQQPFRYLTTDDRIEMIHTFIESNLPDFHNRVVRLILKMNMFDQKEHFAIDGGRLKKIFPNLKSIYYQDQIEITNTPEDVCIMNPFELGEFCFRLARDGDITMANTLVRALWAFSPKWARFFREVARDYYCKPEDHMTQNTESVLYASTGMDHLFHIYLLGWYCAGETGERVLVTKHKGLNKAIDLLPIRFQNCSMKEAAEKLYCDFQHIKNDEHFDHTQFTKVLNEADRIYPGVSTKIGEVYGGMYGEIQNK